MVPGGAVCEARAAGLFVSRAGRRVGVATEKKASAEGGKRMPSKVHTLDGKQAAAYLNVSTDWLYSRANGGGLGGAAFRVGREWRFRRSKLDDWMDNGGEGARA